jgi:TRAP-type transport system small permease protein
MGTSDPSRVADTPVIDRIIRWISQAAYAVGLAILSFMAVLTLVDVIGRAGFNKPITGSFELTQLMFAAGVALVIGYSVVLKSHIRIDMLVNYFPLKAQVVLEIISHFICAVFFLAASWASWRQGMTVHEQGTTSGVMAIPIFPLYYILAFGCLLSGILYFIYFLRTISQKKLKVD